MTAVSAPVSPRVARCTPTAGKHKPCKGKAPFVGGFRTLLRKSAGGTKISRRYENKQEKARGCLALPSQDTADGNADRIRLCRAFGDCNKNCDLGVEQIKTSQV